jgi:hypothetical protein
MTVYGPQRPGLTDVRPAAGRKEAGPSNGTSQYAKGAETAHQLITGAASNGHTADRIEEWQEQIHLPEAGPSTADREWLRGYEHQAAAAIAGLRELEQEDATQSDLEAEAG